MNDPHDVQTDNPEPMKTQLNMVMQKLVNIFPGKSITLLMTDFGEDKDKRMYYVSNSNRDDMMKAIQKYITAHQHHG